MADFAAFLENASIHNSSRFFYNDTFEGKQYLTCHIQGVSGGKGNILIYFYIPEAYIMEHPVYGLIRSRHSEGKVFLILNISLYVFNERHMF